MKLIYGLPLSLLALATTTNVFADNTTPTASNNDTMKEIAVVGHKKNYAVSHVSEDMIARRPANSSVNDVVKELPGVMVQEGDTFGSSDWATNIRMRGFDSNDGQIGTTIDGIPNGGSGYGGGSKANRFLDVLDLKTVEVSQGTADISSRSNEALGGTLNFVSSDPLKDKNLNILYMMGDQEAHKYRFRYDTGEILPKTYAFISGSSSDNKDVFDQKANAEHDYLTGKIKSDVNGYKLTGFMTYNKANESEFSSVSLDQWHADPTHDGLEMNWTGIPGIDQNYRAVSRALRDNTLTYFKVAKDYGAFDFDSAVYYHRMTGRGDWMPPYMLDTNKNGSLKEEMTHGYTHVGDKAGGPQVYFVNPDQTVAHMTSTTCKGRYGLDGNQDPNCYASNVSAVSSYRTSNYANRRGGITGDLGYKFNIGSVKNKLRGGFWYEDYVSEVTREWHKVLHPQTGPAFDRTPYWIQYHDHTDVKETMYYLQENASLAAFTASLGVKQYNVKTRFQEPIGNGKDISFNSTSKPLLYAGLTYMTPLKGLQLFTGYSENYSAINGDEISSVDNSSQLSSLKPETADNIELGARYNHGPLAASATLYHIKFDNRIVQIDKKDVEAGSSYNYLNAADGTYVNTGGQESKGVELAAAYRLGYGVRLSGSYTYNNAEYLTTGSTGLDHDSDIIAGNKVYGEPEQFFTVAADYTGDVLNTGISLRHIGDNYINFENSASIPAYNITDMYIGTDINNVSTDLKAVHLRLNVNNLLDTKYASVDSDSVYPGSPRTVTFTVSADML